jgi:hypothetical protein
MPSVIKNAIPINNGNLNILSFSPSNPSLINKPGLLKGFPSSLPKRAISILPLQ